MSVSIRSREKNMIDIHAMLIINHDLIVMPFLFDFFEKKNY